MNKTTDKKERTEQPLQQTNSDRVLSDLLRIASKNPFDRSARRSAGAIRTLVGRKPQTGGC